MLNINDLEKRYKIYRLKTFIPYMVIFVSLCIIIFVVIFIKNSDMFKSNEAKSNQKNIEAEFQQPKKALIKNINEKNETTQVIAHKQNLEQNLILTPSLNFISSIKHNSISNDTNYQRVINKEEKKQERKKIKQEIILKPAKIEPKAVIIEEVELDRAEPFKIHRQNTQEDINHIIKRFKKNNNPALSLFIAKNYYELEDYSQSYNYALITNRINDNIDESWIIFAKSLVKLNKKDEAIKTLKKYINHSESTQASTLLEEIQRGKFK